jgi:hypothetical protein
MRVPQVSERIKEAPAQALRGVFAGIGQLLLITDKIRNKASHQNVPRARAPQVPATVTDATVTSPADQGAAAPVKPIGAAATSAAAAPAETVAQAAPTAAKPAAARRTTAKPATAKPAAGKPVTPKPATKPATPRRTAAKAAAAESAGETAPKPPKPQSTRDLDKTGNVRLLSDGANGSAVAAAAPAPLPNYDELSVPSLRARLRNLDVTQVRQLAEYERAHAARTEVLTMFERRIAKLEAEA